MIKVPSNINIATIKNDIIVDGLDDIKVNLSGCCKPIPGDDIVGYISRTRGVIIHRKVLIN